MSFATGLSSWVAADAATQAAPVERLLGLLKDIGVHPEIGVSDGERLPSVSNLVLVSTSTTLANNEFGRDGDFHRFGVVRKTVEE